jgi:hypothetical protein
MRIELVGDGVQARGKADKCRRNGGDGAPEIQHLLISLTGD